MTTGGALISEAAASKDFKLFVKTALVKTRGERIKKDTYIDPMCFEISKFIKGQSSRLLINLPPQHLKSFVGTVCLAAYLLGTDPKLRIILVAYGDTLADQFCEAIREIMVSDWYGRLFATRVKSIHARRNDFATREGGGVYAAAATGSITGRPADVIIYDDPHEIIDWNNARKLAVVWDNFNTLISRLNNKNKGRIIVIAHRVSVDDISAKLLQEDDWTYLRLPLIGIQDKSYPIANSLWTHHAGDLLRPDAYPDSEIRRLRRTQTSPPFELFYQQGLDEKKLRPIRPENFGSFQPHELPVGPVVLSIDPGLSSGPKASRSVIQAWKYATGRYYLLDQFCDDCDAEELKSMFWLFVRRYRPSVALIENTANGPALRSLVHKKAKFQITLVNPRLISKAARLDDHKPKIFASKIVLPELAPWHENFMAEISNLNPDFTDQIDAATQYLDFMDTKPIIPSRPARESGIAVAYGSHYKRRM